MKISFHLKLDVVTKIIESNLFRINFQLESFIVNALYLIRDLGSSLGLELKARVCLISCISIELSCQNMVKLIEIRYVLLKVNGLDRARMQIYQGSTMPGLVTQSSS